MKVNIKNLEVKRLKINSNCCDVSKESSSLKLSMNPELLEKIQSKINSPDDIDQVTKELEISSKLVNYHLASNVDLSSLNIKGINNMVHIPIAISKREGGRPSIYRLEKGQTTLVGMYINNQGIILKHFTRESGDTESAKIGDQYRYTLKDLSGNLYYEGIGELESFDKEKGKGKINFLKTSTEQMAKPKVFIKHVTYIWSMYEATVVIYL